MEENPSVQGQNKNYKSNSKKNANSSTYGGTIEFLKKSSSFENKNFKTRLSSPNFQNLSSNNLNIRNKNNSGILTCNNTKHIKELTEFQKSLKMKLNKNSNKILENIRRLNCSGGQNTFETSRNRSRDPPNKRNKNKSQKNLKYGDYKITGINDDCEYQNSDLNNYHTINNPKEFFHQSSISGCNNMDIRKFERSKSPGK